MKRKKGIISLEIIVSLFIISILISLTYIKFQNINEKKDIERAVGIFQTLIYKYSNKSLLLKKTYNIEINHKQKIINVKDIQNKVVEEIKLPEKLKYMTPYDKVIVKQMEFNTTISGNLSKSFSVYIFNYSDEAEYRIAYYSFQQSRILKINSYRNINAGKIKCDEILRYHYEADENEARKGWQKE